MLLVLGSFLYYCSRRLCAGFVLDRVIVLVVGALSFVRGLCYMIGFWFEACSLSLMCFLNTMKHKEHEYHGFGFCFP